MAGIIAGASHLEAAPQAAQTISAGDRIRIATIGFGGMGSGDTRFALNVPGVELVAVCDIYDGRLARARELAIASLPRATTAKSLCARTSMP